MKHIFTTLITILISQTLISQNCDCLISEVENNTVSSCTYTIGTIDTVYNNTELVNAINQANSTGGNRTILIADGTYPIASSSWYPYITASNIVFRSLSGNRDAVILTGTGMANSPGVEIGIYAVGDNITIADLTIKDIGNHGIAVTGDNLYVYNVKIQDTYEQMIKGNSGGTGTTNGIVKCSLFEYTNGIGPNWYIGGLDIHTGIDWTVSDNVFKDIASPAGAVAEHAIHFWDSSQNNMIERNRIINCDRGIGFGLGQGSANSANIGGVIKNNMITNDGGHPYSDVGIGLESSPNTKVYNNTIYINYPNAIEYRFTATINVDITNNITNKLIQSRTGGTATLTTNNTSALTSWFVNTAAGDLRLAGNNASVVDMGTTLASVTMDLDKVVRPQFSNYDLGAHEYQGNVGVNDAKEDIKSNVTVYPSPSSTHFTLTSTSNEISTVSIYNSLGQEVKTFTNVSLLNGITINVTDWEKGIYYSRIISANSYTESVKIIVSK